MARGASGRRRLGARKKQPFERPDDNQYESLLFFRLCRMSFARLTMITEASQTHILSPIISERVRESLGDPNRAVATLPAVLQKDPQAAPAILQMCMDANAIGIVSAIADILPPSSPLARLCLEAIGRKVTEMAGYGKKFNAKLSAYGIRFLETAMYSSFEPSTTLYFASLEHLCRTELGEGAESALYKQKNLNPQACYTSAYNAATHGFKASFLHSPEYTVRLLRLLLIRGMPRVAQQFCYQRIATVLRDILTENPEKSPVLHEAAQNAAEMLSKLEWHRPLGAPLEYYKNTERVTIQDAFAKPRTKNVGRRGGFDRLEESY